MSDKPVCERTQPTPDGVVHLLFWCPGCDTHHGPTIEGPRTWQFNGDYVKPTLAPSILVRGYEISEEGLAMIARGEEPPDNGEPRVSRRYPGRDTVCHSFVRDGRIEFLSDCTHALAGQTVPLEPLE